MNFQDKVFESAADFRARAIALTQTTLAGARSRATQAAGSVAQLKTSLAALRVAGRELNKVASRHVARFVKQNSSLAREAGKEVSALARSTYRQLSKREATAGKSRKTVTRKRAASSTRTRTAAKAA